MDGFHIFDISFELANIRGADQASRTTAVTN
jgi:hypothetical protein